MREQAARSEGMRAAKAKRSKKKRKKRKQQQESQAQVQAMWKNQLGENENGGVMGQKESVVPGEGEEEEKERAKTDATEQEQADMESVEGISRKEQEIVMEATKAVKKEGEETKAGKGQAKRLQNEIMRRRDLLVDGKVVGASYHAGVTEHFVHIIRVTEDEEGKRQRFIVGARATIKGKQGEWGAAMSLLDALLRSEDSEESNVLWSYDAGMTVRQFAAWQTYQGVFYLARIKGNSGNLYGWVCEWARYVFEKRPGGDLFEPARVSGSQVHSRRLWQITLSDAARSIYPGIREVFIVVKKDLNKENQKIQHVISSYPPEHWAPQEILQHILLHRDTETGVFSKKDRTFGEDHARYNHLSGVLLAANCSTWLLISFMRPPLRVFGPKMLPSLSVCNFCEITPTTAPYS